MKTINKTFVAVLVVFFSAGFLLPLRASAQPAPYGGYEEEGPPQGPAQDRGRRGQYRPGEGRQGKAGKFLEDLGLTEEQKEQLKKLREQGSAQLKPVIEQIQSRKEELKQVMSAETFDQAKAYALVDEMTVLTGKTMRARIDQVAALKKVLTPEQFKKMTEARGKIQQFRKETIKKRWQEKTGPRRGGPEGEGPDPLGF